MIGLSDDDVRNIRRLVRIGESQKNVAERFGVSPKTICLIVARKRYANVGDKP